MKGKILLITTGLVLVTGPCWGLVLEQGDLYPDAIGEYSQLKHSLEKPYEVSTMQLLNNIDIVNFTLANDMLQNEQIGIDEFQQDVRLIINKLISNQGLDQTQDLGTFGKYLKALDWIVEVAQRQEIIKEIKKISDEEGNIRTDIIYKIGDINLTVSEFTDREVIAIDRLIYVNNNDFRGKMIIVSQYNQKGSLICSVISKQVEGGNDYRVINDSIMLRRFSYGSSEPQIPIPVETIEFNPIEENELRSEILKLKNELIRNQGLDLGQDLGEFGVYINELNKILEDLDIEEIGKFEETTNTFWNGRPVKIKHIIYKIGERYVEISDSPLPQERFIKISNSIFHGNDDLRTNLKFSQGREGTKISQYVEKKEGTEEVEWVKVEKTQIEKMFLYGEIQDRTSTYFEEIKSSLENLAKLQNAIDEAGNYVGKFGEMISELISWFKDIDDIVKIFDNLITADGVIVNAYLVYLDRNDSDKLYIYISQDKEGNINYVEAVKSPFSSESYHIQILIDRERDKIGVFKSNIINYYEQGQEIATRQLYHIGEKNPYEDKNQLVREWKTLPFSEIKKELNSLPDQLQKIQNLSSLNNEFGSFIDKVMKGIEDLDVLKEIRVMTHYYWDGSSEKSYFFETYGVMGWPTDELNILYSKEGEILAVERAWPDHIGSTNERYIIAFSPDNLLVKGDLPEDYENSTIVIYQHWSYFDFDPSSETFYTGKLKENAGFLFNYSEGMYYAEFIPQEEWFEYRQLYNLDYWF